MGALDAREAVIEAPDEKVMLLRETVLFDVASESAIVPI